MRSNSINSRIAARRSHSLTRRRTGRGGKSGSRPSAHFSLFPLARFPPAQKTVAQHHCEGMPLKALPAAPLILIPAQLRFRFFMLRLHPVAALRILHHHGQRHRGREITPEIFPVPALAPPGALPEQPATVGGALAIHPPAAPGEKLGAPPPLGTFAPRERL